MNLQRPYRSTKVNHHIYQPPYTTIYHHIYQGPYISNHHKNFKRLYLESNVGFLDYEALYNFAPQLHQLKAELILEINSFKRNLNTEVKKETTFCNGKKNQY
jgi:hypothetical protein